MQPSFPQIEIEESASKVVIHIETECCEIRVNCVSVFVHVHATPTIDKQFLAFIRSICRPVHWHLSIVSPFFIENNFVIHWPTERLM